VSTTITPPPSNAAAKAYEFLNQLENGHFMRKFGEQLQEVVQAITSYQGKKTPGGKVTLTFNLVYPGEVMEVTPDITTKVPKQPHGRNLFYPTPENNLSRTDPKQPDLPLRVVTAPTASHGHA